MDPKEYFASLGKKGGKARMAGMTPDQRKAMAKKGQAALRKKIKSLDSKAV